MASSQPNEEQPKPPHAVGARRRLPPLLVTAAFLVAGGVGLFLVLTGGSTHDGATHGTTTAATTAATSPGQSHNSNLGPNQAAHPSGNGGNGTVPTLAVAQLGSFADEAGLIRALGAVDPRTLSSVVSARPTTTDGSATVPSSAVERCEPTARGLLPRRVTDRLAVGVGTVGERGLLVFSFRTSVTSSSPKGALLVAVDRTNCYPVTVHIR